MTGMVGRTYLERGEFVVVVCRWFGNGTPRNVLIRRANGTLVVRPFRATSAPRTPPPAQPAPASTSR